MQIVLKNDSNYYIKVKKTGGIIPTRKKSDATIFNSIEEVEQIKLTAPSRLKSYKIINLDVDAIATQSVIKPHRTKFGKTTRQSIYHNSNCHCQICGKLITYEEFTVDHIIPLAKGGTNDMNNLQSSCLHCNQIKADILPDDFNETIQNITLYNMTNHYNKSFAKSIIKIYLKNIFK